MSADPITTIVLAAGQSVRHRDGDQERPKQFREFWYRQKHMKMWEAAIEGLTTPARLHLAVRRDHSVWYGAPQHRRAVELLQLDRTDGQAHTLEQALGHVMHRSKEFSDLLVVNCDQGFPPHKLDVLVAQGRTNAKPAALVTEVARTESEMRWSFVDADASDDDPVTSKWFHQAFEHIRASKWGLAGAYYFPDAGALKRALRGEVPGLDEPYISNVYDYLNGPKLAIPVPRSKWEDWGTSAAFDDWYDRGGHLHTIEGELR